MFEFLDFITDIKYRLKPLTCTESTIQVWIDYYAADFLDSLSIESREMFSKMCFADWTGTRFRSRFGVNSAIRDFDEYAEYISHVVSAFCKEKLKERLIMAHRMSVSGYTVEGIANSIGCDVLFTKELLEYHRHIAEKIFKAEKDNERYFSSKGYKSSMFVAR